MSVFGPGGGTSGEGAGAELSNSAPAALGAAASPGTAATAARADHVHPRPSPGDIGAAVLGSTVPAALAAAGSAGTATTAARADHVHPRPTPAEISAAATAESGNSLAIPAAAGDPAVDNTLRVNTTLQRLRARINGVVFSLVRSLGDVLTGALRGTIRDLTDAATVTPDLSAGAAASGNLFRLTATSAIGATRQLALPIGLAANEGATVLLRYTQDASGSRALTFASGYTLRSGAIANTANAVSLLSIAYWADGSGAVTADVVIT